MNENYTAPEIFVLGSVTELTLSKMPTGNDGVKGSFEDLPPPS